MFLRPNADDVDGNWLNESGSNTNLFASLDETVASDTDYIQSPATPVNEVCRIALGDPTGTPAEPFVLRYRFNNSGGATLQVRLMQGATPIASWNETGSGWTTSVRTLTSPQFAAITDFTNLFVELTAGGGSPLVLDLDFTTGVLDPKITFTRTTTATYINSAGVVTVTAINVPRFDYDPVTLAARGLLIEEQRTNLLAWAVDVVNSSAWIAFGSGDGTVSGSSAAGTGPDNTTSAALITINRATSGSLAINYQPFSGASAVTHAASIWLKAFAAGDIGKIVGIYISIGSTIAANPQVALTANWKRYTFTGLLDPATCQFGVGYIGADTSVGQVKFLAWGGQVEPGTFPTSDIPSTNAPSTRAADVAVMTGTDFSSWYTSAAGTFVAQFDGPADGTRPIVAVDNTTANETIMLYGSGTDPKALVTNAGVTQADLDAGTIVANTVAKLGLSFAANDFAACLNGGTVALDTGGTLPTVTQARLGVGPAGNYLNGHLAKLQFHNVAKTDAELQSLTT